MKKITFDLLIRPETTVRDHQRLDIKSLDERGLRRLGTGKLFIVFEPQRDYIVIESELLDYLLQLRGVIQQIDAGNHETFAVSGDYFSNHLRFTYRPQDKGLEIYEANGGDFKINISYKDFRLAFTKFYPEAISDFTLLYPELKKNEAFQKHYM